MRHLKIDRSGFHRNLLAKLLAVFAAALAVAAPVAAQDDTGAPPENTQNRAFGAS